jgi:hypothetical protein
MIGNGAQPIYEHSHQSLSLPISIVAAYEPPLPHICLPLNGDVHSLVRPTNGNMVF